MLRRGLVVMVGALMIMLAVEGALAWPDQCDSPRIVGAYSDTGKESGHVVRASDSTPLPVDGMNGNESVGAGTNTSMGAYEAGDGETFIIDSMPVNATCSQVGRHCYVFLEEDCFANGPAFNLDSLRETFDEVIYPQNTEIFGSEPGYDDDERIFIVIMGSLNGAAGMFAPESVACNQKDMLLIDSMTFLFGDIDSTIAHEFQHLIHSGHDFDEGFMVDEGCAVYAQLLYANFSTENLPVFEIARENPGVSLEWAGEEYAQRNNMTAHYGLSGLWILYLSEKYGDLSGNPDHAHFIRDLVEEDRNEFEGVDAAFALHGYEERSEDVFKTWVVANYLDDTGANRLYGYETIDFAAPMHREASVELSELSLKNGSYSFPALTLPAWSAAYYTVSSDAPGNLSFSCEGGCWWHRIDEGNRSVTVVVSPLNVSGEAKLSVHTN